MLLLVLDIQTRICDWEINTKPASTQDWGLTVLLHCIVKKQKTHTPNRNKGLIILLYCTVKKQTNPETKFNCTVTLYC